MKKLLFYYILMTFLFSNGIHSQIISSSHNLKIPDSIYNKLEKFYMKESGEDIYSHISVYNLINKKDFIFKSGVYTFNLTGPHYPRRIFIFYNSKLFIFKSKGAFDSIGILEEFVACIKLLNISEPDRVKYLKAISKYLQEELGQTYGSEITVMYQN